MKPTDADDLNNLSEPIDRLKAEREGQEAEQPMGKRDGPAWDFKRVLQWERNPTLN